MKTAEKKCPQCGKPPSVIMGRQIRCGACGYDETGLYPEKEEQSEQERDGSRVQVSTGDRSVSGSGDGRGSDEGRPRVDGGRGVDRGSRSKGRGTPDEFVTGLVDCWLQIDDDGYLARAPGARRVLEFLYERAMERGWIYVMAGRDWIGEQLEISGAAVGAHLDRLEELGWLKKVPLSELKTKNRSTWWLVKKRQAAGGGGRAITVVELRNNPDTKTLWMRQAA